METTLNMCVCMYALYMVYTVICGCLIWLLNNYTCLMINCWNMWKAMHSNSSLVAVQYLILNVW